MSSALITIALLVLFVGSFVGSFAALSFTTHKVIGFINGGRLLVYTKEDAISERKHRLLLAGYEVIALLLGAFALGLSAPWLGLLLSCAFGAVLGFGASFWLDRTRLLPAGWPRKPR
jgi:hypothetical protein